MDMKQKRHLLVTAIIFTIMYLTLVVLSGCRTKKVMTESVSIDTTKIETDSVKVVQSSVESTENLKYVTEFGLIEFDKGGELFIDTNGNVKAYGVKSYKRQHGSINSKGVRKKTTNDSGHVKKKQSNGIRNKANSNVTHEKVASPLKWYQRIVYRIGGFAILVVIIGFALRKTIRKLPFTNIFK